MKAIYGLYPNPDAAQRAVNSLRASGVADEDIAVMSSEPIMHHEFGQRDKKSNLPMIATLAGAIGCVAGIALTSLTQLDASLVTGGMPVVSVWTNLVIIFEMTMLSAVLATVVTLLVTAGLSMRVPEFYDPEVSNGKILIGVANPPAEHLSALEEALRVGGELKHLR
jgi:hypothetical protein